jgi:hypothetical protein
VRRTKKRAAASGSRLHLFRGLLFTLVAVAAWVLINVQNLQEFMDTYQKREAEREQIDVLKQKIKRLKRQQQSLAYNGIESERQVRERMNLHLPGEEVLYLKDEEPATATKPEDAKPEPGASAAKPTDDKHAAVPTEPNLTEKTPSKNKTNREKTASLNKSQDPQ